jgi:hypothetical protein
VFLQLLDRVLPFLRKSSSSSSSSSKGKVCPNGHVMHPSWDTCPYCLEMQQAMMGGAPSSTAMPMPMPGAGQGTAMLNVLEIGGEKGRGSQDKSREVCGWMVALNGQHKGEDFRLRVGKNVLGTAADCDIVLTDKKISRKHATIRYEGGEFQIADLDSSNGTFVNDEKVQKHDLIDNDMVKLGDIEFEFKCRAMREKRE